MVTLDYVDCLSNIFRHVLQLNKWMVKCRQLIVQSCCQKSRQHHSGMTQSCLLSCIRCLHASLRKPMKCCCLFLSVTCFIVQSQEQKDNGVKCECIVDTSSRLTAVHMNKYLPVTQMTNTSRCAKYLSHFCTNGIKIVEILLQWGLLVQSESGLPLSIQ